MKSNSSRWNKGSPDPLKCTCPISRMVGSIPSNVSPRHEFQAFGRSMHAEIGTHAAFQVAGRADIDLHVGRARIGLRRGRNFAGEPRRSSTHTAATRWTLRAERIAVVRSRHEGEVADSVFPSRPRDHAPKDVLTPCKELTPAPVVGAQPQFIFTPARHSQGRK